VVFGLWYLVFALLSLDFLIWSLNFVVGLWYLTFVLLSLGLRSAAFGLWSLVCELWSLVFGV